MWTSTEPFKSPTTKTPALLENDPEVKRGQVFDTKVKCTESTNLLDQLECYSDWTKAKRIVARCLKFKLKLKRYKQLDLDQNMKQLSVADLQDAEAAIIRMVQRDAFQEEVSALEIKRENDDGRKSAVKRTSPTYKLDPNIDNRGIMRVGGRIRNGDYDLSTKHPIILPRKSHVTELIIIHFHKRISHQGRSLTTNEIRSNGFWIVGCSSAVYSLISKCVTCRKQRNKCSSQKMSDLPSDRLSAEPPFTYSGVDFFGPWIIKDGRKGVKRYGVLFTCMSCRAIHLETANSLDTSSFINALRRFISIRGPIRQLRCDRGTNFVGAKHELRDALMELDEEQLNRYLTKEGCDYIPFKMNVPSASHMGGSWERQIRTVRNVLLSILTNGGLQLDDESLKTFMCETMAIVNSLPLTVDNIHDPESLEPFTPNHLLTMKSRMILPPPGNFQRTDLYVNKRWRRVQHLANEFWTRWKKEFLQTLQVRSKWLSPQRNIRVGDVVLIKDDNLPRNEWRLARVVGTSAGNDGHVRTAKVVIESQNLDSRGKRDGDLSALERPIHKLVLPKETEEVPTEEPMD